MWAVLHKSVEQQYVVWVLPYDEAVVVPEQLPLKIAARVALFELDDVIIFWKRLNQGEMRETLSLTVQ